MTGTTKNRMKNFQTHLALIISLTTQTNTVLGMKMRYCNRGFCYTKNEENSPSTTQIHTNSHFEYEFHATDRHTKRTGFDFCTDTEGKLMDCEILDILGTEDYMAVVEDSVTKNESGRSWEDWTWKAIFERFNSNFKNGEKKEEKSMGHHISWELEPKKGHCFDYDAGYSFECNLVKILDEDIVLIEDLRLGGVLAALPKSGFTTRKENLCQPHMEPVHTPSVLCGSEVDPVEDWRTNVEINLQGM